MRPLTALEEMFDFNRDGKLDAFELSAECMFFDELDRESRSKSNRYESDWDDDDEEDEEWEEDE